MDKEKAYILLHELSRKLTLLGIERKSIKRREIIDGILLDEEGELRQLKGLLELDKE